VLFDSTKEEKQKSFLAETIDKFVDEEKSDEP